ncbi:hypothetical protein Pfo_027407 [Paulownia fortunei]|nr:hypothetical protein Pfo_027407 [Paulownia fortunei]
MKKSSTIYSFIKLFLMVSKKETAKSSQYQRELVFSLSKDIEHKNRMMVEMAHKMEHKDNLLEAGKAVYILHSMQLKGKLRDLEAEIEYLKAENQTLIVKERICNDELQAARKEAIRKWSDKDWREESDKLWSLWEQNVKNPNWHPFKRIKINGSLQEVIDEDDAKLKQLRNEGDEEVYEAVENALLELNEYNPGGRYPILEFWNNKEKRKASLTEIIQYIIKQLKIIKPKWKRALLLS